MSDQLLVSMRQRLSDAEGDAHRLRAAIAVLEAEEKGVSPTPQSSAPPKARRQQRATVQKRGQVVPAGKVMAAVAAEKGISASQLSKQLSGDQRQILALLKEAETEGTVRREGERRATRWFVVTDEDRIAARAAELTAQAKQTPKARAKPKSEQ